MIFKWGDSHLEFGPPSVRLNRGFVLPPPPTHAYCLLPSNQKPLAKWLGVPGNGVTLTLTLSAYCTAGWRSMLIGGANWEMKGEALGYNDSSDKESSHHQFPYSIVQFFSHIPCLRCVPHTHTYTHFFSQQQEAVDLLDCTWTSLDPPVNTAAGLSPFKLSESLTAKCM